MTASEIFIKKAELEAAVHKALRADADIREIMAIMPVSDQAKVSIWALLAVAFTAGMLHQMKDKK